MRMKESATERLAKRVETGVTATGYFVGGVLLFLFGFIAIAVLISK